MRNSKQAEANSFAKFLRALLIGTGIGLLVTIILLVIFSVVMSLKDLPQVAVTPLAIASTAIGAFFAGFFSSKIRKENGLFIGFCSGFLFFLFLAIASFSLTEAEIGLNLLFKFMVVVFASMIGAVIGVNQKKHRK